MPYVTGGSTALRKLETMKNFTSIAELRKNNTNTALLLLSNTSLVAKLRKNSTKCTIFLQIIRERNG